MRQFVQLDLMFDDGTVLNIRKHNGYKVSLEI